MTQKATLSFCGGTGTVTGANFLLEIPIEEKIVKILVDCGMEQGSEFADASNREEFPFDPKTVDYLFITHAHTDHIGRIPKLVKDGFKGTIYSTPATLDLSKVMLPDALYLIDEDARRKGILALFEAKDVDMTLSLWKTIGYHTSMSVTDGISVYVKDSGHILGSAMYEFHLEALLPSGESSLGSKASKSMKIVFTGDLGNSPSLFLRDTDKVTDATYLLMESVYGDRNHESKDERTQKLMDVINDTIKRKRTLIIPAFSLERTQDILYEINELVENKKIGSIQVFLDSPLASAVTQIYKKYSSDFKDSAKQMVAEGDDLFNFPGLKTTLERRDSERLDMIAGPKIIMAGSGMSNGGRIVKHEKHYLPDSNTTILLVGYQALGTLGRQILDGAKKLMIDGEEISVRAEVASIMGYSSHKDSDHLIEFVSDTAATVKKVFVTMGEPKSALFLTQRLRDYLNVNATAPKKGDKVELEF